MKSTTSPTTSIIRKKWWFFVRQKNKKSLLLGTILTFFIIGYFALQKQIIVSLDELSSVSQQQDGGGGGGNGGVLSPNRLLQQYTTKTTTTTQQQQQQRRQRNQLLSLGPIFYNIYIPNSTTTTTTELQDNAWRIVREQMEQRSIADPNSNVVYTLIDGIGSNSGQKSYTEEEDYYNKLVCGGDKNNLCRMNVHLEMGNEVNTLQSLYEYCQQRPNGNENLKEDESPDVLVSYIHNKGSFHWTEHNEKTRRTATKATLDCRNEMLKYSDVTTYNVCSGTMVILPQYLCNANMWTAKCSYIRKLIPPIEYSQRMEQFYNDTLLHPQLSKTKYACLQPIHWKENHLGLHRYAYERWVWSHPDVIPADIIPFGNKINFTEYPPKWKPRLSRSLKGSPKRMALHEGFGISSFARLEGRLLEWDYLYHKQPKNDSWIWKYYKGYETGTPAYKVRYCGLGL